MRPKLPATRANSLYYSLSRLAAAVCTSLWTIPKKTRIRVVIGHSHQLTGLRFIESKGFFFPTASESVFTFRRFIFFHFPNLTCRYSPSYHCNVCLTADSLCFIPTNCGFFISHQFSLSEYSRSLVLSQNVCHLSCLRSPPSFITIMDFPRTFPISPLPRHVHGSPKFSSSA